LKQEVQGFDENRYSSQTLEEVIWKNNDVVKFVVDYMKCPEMDNMKTTWSYNIQNQKITKLFSKIVPFNP